MKILVRLLLVGCFGVIPACGLFRGTSEPIRSYVLEIEEGHEIQEIHTSPSLNLPSLLVSPPQPAPGFESQRMAYEQVPHELRYFATSQWVDSPARMLASLIMQTLETSDTWGSVAQIPTVIRGDYRLDISRVTLVQEFTRQPSRIRFTLYGQLVTVYDPRIIGRRSFEFREESPTEDAYGGVLAAQRAVRQFLDELTKWLNGCVHGSPSYPC